MAVKIVLSLRETLNKIVLLFFFSLFNIVNLLILIGEVTQKIAFYPAKYFLSFILFIKNVLNSLISLKVNNNATKLHDEKQIDIDLDEVEDFGIDVVDINIEQQFAEFCIYVRIPRYRLLNPPRPLGLTEYISLQFNGSKIAINGIFKTILTGTRNISILGVRNLRKVVFSLIRVSLKGIKKLPLATYYVVNELAYFLYSLIHGVIQTIINIYRFVTSIYFRYFLYGIGFCLIMVGIYQSYLFVNSLPSPYSIGKMNFARSTHLYDRNGKLLYEIYRDINRTPIKLKDLPPYAVQASIAIEDKNFYSHRGVSFFGGMLRAVKDTLKTSELQGGSTITQQLVKSALLSPERTFERKAKEILLAVWTEQIYNKEQILEMYLNQVPYGGSAYGIEEASKVYFGKSAKYLTLDEAALLAGLPQAPSLYSPFVNKSLAKKRRNDVLKAMYQQGYIKKANYDSALAKSVQVLSPTTNIKAPHFVFYTRNALEEEFGTRQVEEGGFRVTTSLDLDIQTKAETILKEELEKIKNLNVQNGGIIVLNPKNGEILAMVGSVDYFSEKDGAFNVTTALRQPGSTLKPMLYAMAMEHGYTAATAIDDSPIVFQVPGGEGYRPVNYDGRFHGRVTLRTALSNSYNIPAVKVMNAMGVQPFVDYAKKMGIDSWQDSSRFGLSLSLGGGEITLVDLAQVYSVFASQGYRVEPNPFIRIIDDKERVILENPTTKAKVMDPGITYIISDILADNVTRQQAFGPNSALEIKGHKVSVKTGTSNDKKDNLTVGYTPEFLVAVWVGNNDNTPMNPYLTSGITGAAPIWNRVMTYLIEEKSKGETFAKPENVIAKPCYGTGKQEYFLIGTDTGFCHDAVIRPRIETQADPEQKRTP